MKSVVKFFIKNVNLANLGIILIALLGTIAATRMNSSFFPKQDEKFIIIEAVYPGASPREVEEGIVLKVEDNLKGVSGIERVTSTSSENQASIRVELESDADADIVLQDVKNAVDQIGNFPEDMERIVVFKQEVVNLTAKIVLSGDVPLLALKKEAELVEDDLRSFPNISKIQIKGFTEEEIEVAVRENKLRAYNITFEDIGDAIRRENIQVTGGTIRGKEETLIRADQKLYHADQLQHIVVKTLDDGSVVHLKDVAHIKEDWAENTDKAYYNGQRAILITVSTLNEENILDAAASIRQYVDEYNDRNKVVKATIADDATKVLNERIALLEKNGLIGAGLVFILLALFLRIRLAFWVALGIPISFLGMFVVANIFGITINVLSLFGMILVVGILVDDGIVVGENIFQHYENGEPPLKAVANGTMEVLPSISSAITTTCVAFAFFFFIEGQLGEFFSDVAFVVIAALIFSLIEVLLFLPAHIAHIKDFTGDTKPHKIKIFIESLLLKFRDRIFSPILDFTVKYKLFSFLAVVAMFIITLGAIRGGIIRTTFFPNIEQNEITVTLELPSGASEKVTEGFMKNIEDRALALNEQYRNDPEVGQDIILDREIVLGPRSNEGQAIFYLVSSEERNIRSFRIAADLRKKVGKIPQAEKLSFETQSPFGKPVNVSFSASNFQLLRTAVEEFQEELRNLGTVKDIITNDRSDQPEVNVKINETGHALGLKAQDVIRQIRNGFFGYEAQRLQRGDNEVKVWVRYDINDRQEVQHLREMRIKTPQGNSVPIQEVASITPQKGLIAINHRDGKREITVEGELASLEVSAPEVLNKIKTDIMPALLSRYPQIDVSYEGQQRETSKLQKSVAQAGPIVLIIMLSLLIITFRSFSQAFALLVLLPFGMIGAGWGHFIHDLPISILSFLGFIALMGVLINDGLVFVNVFNQYLKEGMEYEKALKETAISRFRPLVLTTITTSAGLGPLILEKSFQAQFLIPMAITIAYGLLVGSIFIALVLPITLSMMNRIKVYAKWLWEGKKPPVESVERAIKRKEQETAYEF